MITGLPTKRLKRYHGDKHFSRFLPARWRQKLTGIDVEQNYVTVTPYVLCYRDARTSACQAAGALSLSLLLLLLLLQWWRR